MDTAALRELLTADIAAELGVLSATEAAAALARYWEARDGHLLDAVPDADRARVADAVERALAAAGGDAQAAVRQRGVDRELPSSLAPEASHALSEAGARLRAPLRALDKKRYVGFLPLGQGGMGVVYLALDSELNRRVAFKMIRAGATDPLADESGPVSDDMVARFMQEAVVTGGLEHPGIVPVYELGLTPSGVPYYTMRLVRGERTLDDAIGEARSLEDRLGLLEPFLKVCDAVGYAHSRGVVHRDLKPANIALGQFGEVVVLDWGLAKMHQRPDLAGSRWQSRLGELRETTDLRTLSSALGTPGYMAPEAALGEIEAVDARTDVYSLGAILYRILTGRLPHDFTTFQDYVAKLTGVAPAMDGVPQGLMRITLKALAPRRADRFGGVGELTSAIRAWQRESAIDREVEVLLVEAQTSLETAEGMEGEALLRQLDAAMAVAARILDLRPEQATATALRERARELRGRAIAERESAARRRLLRRVGAAALLAATATTVVVAVLLDARRGEAEQARARAEDLAGFMLNDLHEGLVSVGRTDLLQTVARKSLEYYTSLPDADITDETRRARALVLGRIGEVLQDSGDLQGALHSCLESQRMYESLGDAYELSVALNRTGDVQQESADLEGALASYRRSAQIRRGLDDQSHLARSLDRVAAVLLRMGQREEATKLYGEVLAMRRALARKDPANAAWQLHLALALETQGELAVQTGTVAVARPFFEDALAIRKKLLAAEPADAKLLAGVAAGVFRAAYCQGEAGEHDRERASYNEALATYERLAQLDPSDVWHRRNIALTYARLGRFDEALEVVRGLAARDPANTRAQHDLVRALLDVGDQAKAKDEWDGAMRHYEEALGLVRALVERDPSAAEWQGDLSDALSAVGQVHAHAERAAEARVSFEESVAVMKSLADRDPDNVTWQRALAFSLDQLGRYEESLAIRRSLYAKDPDDKTRINDLAWGLAQVGNTTKDVKYFEEAVPLRRALGDAPHQRRELSFCLYMVGTLYEEKRDLGRALEALREAEEIHRGLEDLADEHHFWAAAYFRVGYDAACEAARQGRTHEALDLLRENLEWSRKHLPKDRLSRHLDHARTKDPDLQALRGEPEFEALFR